MTIDPHDILRGDLNHALSDEATKHPSGFAPEPPSPPFFTIYPRCPSPSFTSTSAQAVHIVFLHQVHRQANQLSALLLLRQWKPTREVPLQRLCCLLGSYCARRADSGVFALGTSEAVPVILHITAPTSDRGWRGIGGHLLERVSALRGVDAGVRCRISSGFGCRQQVVDLSRCSDGGR